MYGCATLPSAFLVLASLAIPLKVIHQRRLLCFFILGALIVSASPAKADFLGFAPGDYDITLGGSSTLCGGSNCTGSIHIGSSGDTGFDWDITVGSDIFEFD